MTRVVDFLQSWKELGVGKDRRLIPVVAATDTAETRFVRETASGAAAGSSRWTTF